MSFEFTIIDGNNFRKYKSIRYGLYYLLILLIFIINEPRIRFRNPSGPNSFAQLLGINTSLLWSLIFIIGIFTLILYFYSKTYRKLGKIEINHHSIVITEGSGTEIFDLSTLTNLVIERGATWHYNYMKRNYLIEIDNWFKFTTNQANREIEFTIPSMLDNENFENMIAFLKREKIKHQYFSI